MTRGVLEHVVQNARGDIQQGTAVYVHEADDSGLLGQPMYDAPAGGATLPNPLVAAPGTAMIRAYVDHPQRIILKVNDAPQASAFLVDPASVWTVNVRAFGPTLRNGDDWSEAIQLAIDALGSDGGTVLFPGGDGYVYRLGSTVELASHLVLYGQGARIARMPGYSGIMLEASDPVEKLTLDGLVFDQESRTGTDILVRIANGSRFVTIEGCHFDNGSPITALLIGPSLPIDDYGDVQGYRITVRGCTFSRTLELQSANAENAGALAICDASHVRIEDNLFDHWGGAGVYAINSAVSGAASPMRDVRVTGNTFVSVSPTSLFVQVGGYTEVADDLVMEQVYVTDNIFSDCGHAVEKGAIGVQAYTGVMRNVHITKNTTRHLSWGGSSVDADYNAAGAIGVFASPGWAVIEDVHVIDNTIDGAASDGTLPPGQNTGIVCDGEISDLFIVKNRIRNLGHTGILVYGCQQKDGTAVASYTAPMRRVLIERNTVVRTCIWSVDRCGGIVVAYLAEQVTVARNLCAGNGPVSGLGEAAGIVLGHWTAYPTGSDPGTPLPSTISDVEIEQNTCYDIGGVQLYGVRIGYTGMLDAATMPVRVRLRGNVLSDNDSRAVFGPTARSFDHVVTDNVDHGGPGELLAWTALATAAFTIPSGSAATPFVGHLTALTVNGDSMGVAVYGVIRNSSGSAFQDFTASPIWSKAVAGGTAPTITAGVDATGTLNMHRGGGAGQTYVFLQPLVRGLL